MCLHFLDFYGIPVYGITVIFSDRQAWANSLDPDQTASLGAVWSGSTLFAILSALLYGKATLFNFRIITAFFLCLHSSDFCRILLKSDFKLWIKCRTTKLITTLIGFIFFYYFFLDFFPFSLQNLCRLRDKIITHHDIIEFQSERVCDNSKIIFLYFNSPFDIHWPDATSYKFCEFLPFPLKDFVHTRELYETFWTAQYLVNLCVDSDQICMNTVLPTNCLS